MSILKSGIIYIIKIILVLYQKVSDTQIQRVVLPAQLIYISTFIEILHALYKRKVHKIGKILIPMLAVLMAPHNLILLPSHMYLEKLLRNLFDESGDILTIYNFFGWALFFQMVS